MRNTVRTLLGAAGVAALSLAPIALSSAGLSLLAAQAVFAGGKGGGGGHGGGQGGGQGGERGGGRGEERSAERGGGGQGASQGQGRYASELKGLNAAHASPTALAHAAANSQVGRIATYQEAALFTLEAEQDLADAEKALQDELDSYTGRTSEEIQSDIGELDPEAEGYEDALSALEDELAAAEAHESRVVELEDAVEAAEDALEGAEDAEAEAFLAASGGRTLSPEAMAYFRGLLGL
jgi:uncharacterized protein YukE